MFATRFVSFRYQTIVLLFFGLIPVCLIQVELEIAGCVTFGGERIAR